MKPSWADAPEWANYLAMDPDGIWFWYEVRPEYHPDSEQWYAEEGEVLESDNSSRIEEARASLESRIDLRRIPS